MAAHRGVSKLAIGLLAVALVAQLEFKPVHANHEPKQAEEANNVEHAIHAAEVAPDNQREESFQRVYEAFTRLTRTVSDNSIGNMRRLVSRLNNLVGMPSSGHSSAASSSRVTTASDSSVEEKTEQVLQKLDQVDRETDQHTLRQLHDDVSKLIGTINESYLRNIRRVVERVNRLIGQQQPTGAAAERDPNGPNSGPNAFRKGSSQNGSQQPLHQSADRLNDETTGSKQPGFPGWDEFIVAVDRMQKSFAQFVRSSTKLVTSG